MLAVPMKTIKGGGGKSNELHVQWVSGIVQTIECGIAKGGSNTWDTTMGPMEDGSLIEDGEGE